MKSTSLILTIVVALFSIKAQCENSHELSADQLIYVESYVNAINMDDTSKLMEITHPDYLSCSTPANNDYYESLRLNTLAREIPTDYKVEITELTPFEQIEEVNGALQRGLPYPVTPTHRIKIDYSKSEFSSVTIYRHLVFENNRYYEVSGCPTEEMLERFRQLELKKAEDKKRAKLLFAEIESDLLLELITLLKSGQKIEAWKLYSKSSGESIGVAKEVLSNASNF